jgi:hypothetical protein
MEFLEYVGLALTGAVTSDLTHQNREVRKNALKCLIISVIVGGLFYLFKYL